MDPLAQRVAAKFATETAHVTPTEVSPRVLSQGEVEHLPVGSIVWEWVDKPEHDKLVSDGRVHGSPLVVIPDGKLTQIALLPERAGGQEPGGDPVAMWGIHKFVLISKGKGKLMTHGTAQHAAESWLKGQKKTSSETDQDAILDILDEIDSKVDPDLLETLGKGLTMHVEKLPNHGGHASTYAHDVVQIAKNLKSVLKELRNSLGG